MTAALHVAGAFGLEQAEEALREGRGLSAANRISSLRPRKVMGKGPVFWGGLRADPAGDGVHLWIAADNLAGAGAAVPLALAEAIFEAGLLTRVEA
jgi:aspartate-semialdehyde dehydrogenase